MWVRFKGRSETKQTVVGGKVLSRVEKLSHECAQFFVLRGLSSNPTDKLAP